MIDAHNHLQDPRFAGLREGIAEELRRLGVTDWCVNGTRQEDWPEVARLAARWEEVVPFFGLHPWNASSRRGGWETELRARLEEHPRAGVGEIGLDKWIRGADLADQKEVFRTQLDLAEELGRPAAVHCLQAWGSLRDLLAERGGRVRVLLHSYGGPVEMVEEFAELGAWFSLSGYFFRPEKRDKLETFARVPPERFLLETDAPDMELPAGLARYSLERESGGNAGGTGRDGSAGTRSRGNHPANLAVIHERAADFIGWTAADLADQVGENFRRWRGEVV